MSTVATNKPPSRAREWTRLIAITGSAQVAVQAIGFACGILVIRLLPVEEYAYYTLANTMLGMMTVLADGGVANGVMSQGGKVWQDKKRLGAVLATGMTLRRQFAVFSVLVAAPLLLYLLRHHGASWATSVTIVVALMPAFVSSLSNRILEIASKLHQDIAALQAIQVMSNGLRLLISALTLIVFPFAAIAILASGISQIVANWRLRKASERFAARAQQEDPEARREILKVVRRILPGAIYYSLAGQVSLWLISIFGSTEGVAQVGALSRVTQVIGIFTAIISTLIIPRFARMPANPRMLSTRFLQLQAAMLSLGALLVAAVSTLPAGALSFLGPDYTGLKTELFLQTAIASIGMAVAVTFQMGSSRGIVFPPSILLPALIVVQVVCISSIAFDTVTSVLLYALAIQVLAYLAHSSYILAKVSR